MTAFADIKHKLSVGMHASPSMTLEQKAEFIAPLVRDVIANFDGSCGKEGVQTFQCQLLDSILIMEC